MSNKLAGPIIAGSTSYSTDVVMIAASDGTEISGLIAANVTASYWRQGDSPTTITLSDLAAITTAYTSGGWKEASSTLAKGTYRLDLPDAALATGADWVEINVSSTGSIVYKERFGLYPAVWDEVMASHLTSGSTGAKLNAAASAGDPWSTLIPASYGAGTAGAILGNLLTAALSESYAADGAPASISQILYMILQSLTEKSISSTTMTVKKLDGSTTAMVFTLNSATTPAGITRSA